VAALCYSVAPLRYALSEDDTNEHDKLAFIHAGNNLWRNKIRAVIYELVSNKMCNVEFDG